jgi:uncharacterized membrane protein YjjP (DUF1212 family)
MPNPHPPAQVLETVGLAAQIILENGAETYRVEDTVCRLCRSYGYPDADVIALSTGLVLSLGAQGSHGAVIHRARSRGINLSRVNAVNDLSRRAAQGLVPLDQAAALLRGIAHSEMLPPWQMVLMCALSAGFFTLMFGGGWLPFAVAAACAALTQMLTNRLSHAPFSLVLVNLAGGALCSALALGAYFVFDFSHAALEAALTGAIMPLLSGLMMTSAVRDALRGDLLSGIARGFEALLVAIMVALGIILVLQFYQPVEAGAVLTDPPWPLAALWAGLATMCFCPLLKTPLRAVLPASLLGAAAYGLYLLLGIFGASATFALFLASAAVSLLGDWLARRMRMIATVFLCVALIPLVPGLGLYRTMRALLLEQTGGAMATGLNTLFAVGAIALGAALGSMRLFRKE